MRLSQLWVWLKQSQGVIGSIPKVGEKREPPEIVIELS